MHRSLVALLPLLPLVAVAADTPAPTPLKEEMQTHWTHVTHARDGVVEGDLAEVKKWAAAMAVLEAPAKLPAPWRPMYADMQAAAGRVAAAEDLPKAAEQVGALALTCAECHDFTGGGPGHLVLPMPEQDFGKDEMALHQWASDWLWIGLISNSTEAWQRGADALQKQPFKHFEKAPAAEAEVLEQTVHIVASLAEVGDRASQAGAYGRLITACATCHAGAK